CARMACRRERRWPPPSCLPTRCLVASPWTTHGRGFGVAPSSSWPAGSSTDTASPRPSSRAWWTALAKCL
ncbi:unnamed protein product, partial [Prorocentrum cordatum]